MHLAGTLTRDSTLSHGTNNAMCHIKDLTRDKKIKKN